MCGLNGFNWEDKDLIDQMNSAIKHRGPDDDGVRVANGLSIGHVRLSIFDLSPRGHQPMASKDERIWVVYNGEVYNFRELRAALEGKGRQFLSDSDTEVIICAYQEYGTAIFEKLNGIFAFALLDLEKNSVFLVRDRLGIKPLYYYFDGKKIVFSSDVTAFAPHSLPLSKDEVSVEEYLTTNNILSESFFEQVKAVQPGTFVRLDLGRPDAVSKVYCDVSERIDVTRYRSNLAKSEKQIIDELDKLLNEVVQDQMISDAPLGTICSGGVDSSLITAIACRYKRDLKIFNVKVADAVYDESPFAQRVAKFLKLDLIQEVLDKEKYLRFYRYCVEREGLPMVHPNSVGIYLVSRQAREAGLSVLLSGEGADELFGGYHHYNAYMKRLIVNRYSFLKFFRPPHNSYLDCDEAPFGVYDNGYGKSPTFDKPYMKLRWELLSKFYRAYSFVEDNEQRRLKTLIAHDLHYFLSPLLRRTDRMPMAVGVEMRVPFLDNRLVDFALNLPVRYQVGLFHSKYILKKVAERYLPREVIYRTKKGFPLPMEQWLGGRKFRDLMLQTWEEQHSQDVRGGF